MSYAPDKQTNKQANKQTDSKILFTPTDVVGVVNNNNNNNNNLMTVFIT